MVEKLHKNNSIEKMQQELAMRAEYYFKGFGALLEGLLAELENFIVLGETPERKKNIREKINKIVSVYQSIPFEQITNHPDYDLLLEMREAISKLVLEIESILGGEKNINGGKELIYLILEKGIEYRNRLSVLLKQINLQPGHENDGFKINSINDSTEWEDYVF